MNNMSDEDFDQLDPDVLFADQAEDDDSQNDSAGQDNADDHQDDNNDDDDQGSEQDDNSANDNDDTTDDNDAENQDQSDDTDQGNDDDAEGEQEDDQTQQEQKQQTAAGKTKNKPVEQKQEAAEQTVDVQEFHAKITAPFKANGKDYQISSPEEAISLMQKGLNYNAKMNGIKDYVSAGRMLEQHELLNKPEELAFLIDLYNKKPEAMAKLIKDSGIDAYELGEEKAEGYKPTPIQAPSENVYQLREIIAANKEDAHFNAMYADVTNWDDTSQQAILNNPDTLLVLQAHKANGAYDTIMKRVNHAIDVQGSKVPVANLYFQFGKEIYGNGNGGGNNNAQATHSTNNTPAKVTKTVDPKLAEKRKNLGGLKNTVKSKSTSQVSTAEELYSMSDEEFEQYERNNAKNL